MKLDGGKNALICRAASMLVCAVLLSAPHADGQTIFNNVNEQQIGLTASSTGWSAQSFISGVSPTTLDSVDIDLLPHAGSGTFLVRLYSNTPSNNPGILIETLSGPSNPEYGTFHYTASGDSILAPNLPYWIVFSSTGGPYAVEAELSLLSIEFGSTIGFKYSSDAGGNWGAHDYSLGMRVMGTREVPEPSTYLLLSAAVILCKRKFNRAIMSR